MKNNLSGQKLFANAEIYYQLPVAKLIAQTLEQNKGALTDTGALVIKTGQFTGRSPADKFIVRDAITENTVEWNKFNNPIGESSFFKLRHGLIAYLDSRTNVWVRDAYACADKSVRIKLRIINEEPWCNQFAANMFIAPDDGELANFEPEWTVIQAPGFKAEPAAHGTRQSNFTVVSFTHKTILIGGTGYTGEIKKSIFTILNYLLPVQHRILTMHCSANKGIAGDTAIFFGLSGTGKTTLSADPARKLIGDDEHGWDDKGIFNLEGGCYAKIINLSAAQEPGIFTAIRTGALVENTQFIHGSDRIDYACKAITENTRVSYPLEFIVNSEIPSMAGAPKNIFFLTCDAYGVLPPISKLTNEQAMYYFMSGYTAKIAGTEEGIKEPEATFSACFGAPFLPLHALQYAELLKEKLERCAANVWLINTGWTGGPYGMGARISIGFTRAMITAVLNSQLDKVAYLSHPVFGLAIPQQCPGVPAEILNPSNTWADEATYYRQANALLEKFRINFMQYEKEPV